MPGDDFQGPVAYADRWFWLAIGGLLVVAVFYLVVTLLWLRGRRRAAAHGGRTVGVPNAKRSHLDRIAAIKAEVASGAVDAREGHQQLSETVRSFVGAVSSIDAAKMTLQDLRRDAPEPVVEAIALMYPPEFAHDGDAAAQFDEAARQAEHVVSSWS